MTSLVKYGTIIVSQENMGCDRKEEKMLNQLVMLGRVKSINESDIIIVNDENEFVIQVSGEMLSNTKDYLSIGDLIGIKAKLMSNNKIVAERITFLSNKEK